ncbi:hypothetical protein Pelo_17920 [Pelomyxa schiedti]|nr:hypothetical protein Pelo_17920 [Pelomyxa schiedti]
MKQRRYLLLLFLLRCLYHVYEHVESNYIYIYPQVSLEVERCNATSVEINGARIIPSTKITLKSEDHIRVGDCGYLIHYSEPVIHNQTPPKEKVLPPEPPKDKMVEIEPRNAEKDDLPAIQPLVSEKKGKQDVEEAHHKEKLPRTNEKDNPVKSVHDKTEGVHTTPKKPSDKTAAEPDLPQPVVQVTETTPKESTPTEHEPSTRPPRRSTFSHRRKTAVTTPSQEAAPPKNPTLPVEAPEPLQKKEEEPPTDQKGKPEAKAKPEENKAEGTA